MKNTRKILRSIIVIVLSITTMFLSSCGILDDPLHDIETEITFDPARIKNPSTVGYELFAGILVLSEVDEETQFYDNYTQKNQTFNYLLDRQFTLLAEQINFALNVIYGSGSINQLLRLESFSGMAIADVSIIGTTSGLSEANKEMTCGHDKSNVLNLSCGECLARVADLRDHFQHTPFYFLDAMDGGAEYNTQTNSFNPSVLITSNAWHYKEGLSIDLLKTAMAKIIATGESHIGSDEGDYQEYLNRIEYLGLLTSEQKEGEDSDLDLIKQYILNNIIGTRQVEFDNLILNELGGSNGNDNININLGEPGSDIFNGNVRLHYYKAYEQVVNQVIDKAAKISVKGMSPDDNGNYLDKDYAAIPTMSKTNVTFLNLEELHYEGDDTLLYYKPQLKQPQKIKQIIAIPKMSDYALSYRYGQLLEMYGTDFADTWEEIADFYLTQLYAVFATPQYDEYPEFVLRLKFLIKIAGRDVLNNYVPPYFTDNTYFTSDGGIVVQEYDTFTVDGIELRGSEVNRAQSMFIFGTSGGSEFSRMQEYDGVQVYNDFNKASDEYFEKGALMVWSNLFDIERKPKDNYDEYETIATFKGGNNIFQFTIECYDGQTGEIIPQQFLNILKFNIVDMFDQV